MKKNTNLLWGMTQAIWDIVPHVIQGPYAKIGFFIQILA